MKKIVQFLDGSRGCHVKTAFGTPIKLRGRRKGGISRGGAGIFLALPSRLLDESAGPEGLSGGPELAIVATLGWRWRAKRTSISSLRTSNFSALLFFNVKT